MARKRRQLRDRAPQRSLTPVSWQRKTNQVIKERFLLKNYVAPMIFKRWRNTDVYKENYKRWRNTDVYKENYKQKAINTACFQQVLKCSSSTVMNFFQ